MADKEQQAYHSPTTNGYSRSSEEEAMRIDAKALRRQKHKKWLLYGIAFVIFQTLIIVLFTMTLMKFRNPKFRVRSATFDTQTATNDSLNLRANMALGIKNTNFGPYKYDSSTIYFYYGETEVGSATVPKSKAQFRGTKKFTIAADLALAGNSGNSQLASDISSGIVPLSSRSTLSGKVELMLIFKKKKSVNMNCTMEVNTSTQALQNIVCK